MKKRVDVSKKIEVLLLLILNLFVRFWTLARLFYFLVILAKKILQRFYLILNLGAIIKKKDLNKDFLNKLAYIFDIEFLNL